MYIKTSFNLHWKYHSFFSLENYQIAGIICKTFKEEEFQAKFLEKIFVDCFGYKSQYDSAEEGNFF